MRCVKNYSKDFGAPERPRALIVLMDGTWNDETGKDGDGVVTNVVKLFRCLGSDTKGQVVRYFRGVGNDEDFGWFGRVRGGAFGRYEAEIRRTAYARIAQEWRPGDRIFLFGFSRGAASARMLARDLHQKGIRQQNRIVTEPKENRWTRAIESAVVDHVTDGEKREVDVEFLGVWDTVAAFGLPWNRWDPFKDMHVSENVKRAVHLVSIDETRKPFRPTLMNHNPGVVHEVWFPGVHSDVGGGYARDEIGRLTLQYMVEQIQERADELGLELDWNEAACEEYVKPSHRMFLHPHGLGLGKDFREIKVQREDERDESLKPKIHSSTFAFQESREIYNVVVEKRWFRASVVRTPRITYHPPNLKILKGRYEEVGATKLGFSGLLPRAAASATNFVRLDEEGGEGPEVGHLESADVRRGRADSD